MYVDQILTSLETLFAGFVLSGLVALPLGVLAGLSTTINAALNPVIQIFKPLPPLAWLPIVTTFVGAAHIGSEPLFEESFVSSAVTVALCSMWPTLINTALGVSSTDRSPASAASVAQLSAVARIRGIVLLASPSIFTGLRLSLGAGWTVLMAAEMLAEHPGLGKHLWDEFQRGSSLASTVMVMLTIGVVGCLLDRLMAALGSAAHVAGNAAATRAGDR